MMLRFAIGGSAECMRSMTETHAKELEGLGHQ